jgi:type II secretion system protein J
MIKTLHNQKGLTLIEILISLTLMAMMFLMMNETMNDVSWTRNKVHNQSEDNHTLFVTFSRLYDDIHQAFLANTSFEGRLKPRLTGFIGTNTSLNFSTMSGLHFIENKPDTHAHHVGYFLQQEDEGGSTLRRRSSDYLLEDLEQGGKTFVMLKRVVSLNLEYYDSNKRNWQSEWDTNKTAFAGRLPEMVKVTLEILGQPKSDKNEEREQLNFEWIIPIEMYKTKINF